MEHELQYVVRNCVADYLERAGWGRNAKLLREGKTDAVAELRKHVDEHVEGWSTHNKVVAVRHDQFYWKLQPTLIKTEGDGLVVKFEWGWGAGIEGEHCPSVTSMGEDAFDLALEILDLFTPDPCRAPKRPSRPEPPEPDESPEFRRGMDAFHEGACALMKAMGDDNGGCSLLEVEAWIQAGRPDTPQPHQYEDFPEDGVRVCSVCGHWYRIDGDDMPHRVCPGEPMRCGSSIHVFDPRRSAELREAQRLDRLIRYMEKLDARGAELEPFQLQLQRVLPHLSDNDRARYDKERVGMGDAPR